MPDKTARLESLLPEVYAARSGEGMLHRVLDGPRDPDALPAQVVVPGDGRVTWLVDAASAPQDDHHP